LQLPRVSTSFQIPDRAAINSRKAVAYAIVRSTVIRYSLHPRIMVGFPRPVCFVYIGKKHKCSIVLGTYISSLPLLHLNNSEDSLITPSIRQTRSTSGSGFLHRKPKSERRSRSTCSHQEDRGIVLDLERRGGRHRRLSTTIAERPSQSSTAKANQGRSRIWENTSATGKARLE
jgi:hypothetical protein